MQVLPYTNRASRQATYPPGSTLTQHTANIPSQHLNTTSILFTAVPLPTTSKASPTPAPMLLPSNTLHTTIKPLPYLPSQDPPPLTNSSPTQLPPSSTSPPSPTHHSLLPNRNRSYNSNIMFRIFNYAQSHPSTSPPSQHHTPSPIPSVRVEIPPSERTPAP